MAYDMQRDFKVIDDTNFQEQISAISSGDRMAGYNPRDYVVSPFTTTPTLGIIRDRKVIVELAIERDRKKQTPDHMHILGGVPILDQNGIPYCWYYGAVGAMMTCYAIQGGFVPHLSATSGAAKIKNYREQGGWAKEALTHERGIQAIGVGELRLWPEHQNDRRYDTPELRENAMMHKVSKFEELPQNDFMALCTYILAGFPVTLGLMWWGHLIFGTKVVVLRNGELGILGVNSWGERWENGGKAILVESKATAHEQIAIMSTTPREKDVSKGNLWSAV